MGGERGRGDRGRMGGDGGEDKRGVVGSRKRDGGGKDGKKWVVG